MMNAQAWIWTKYIIVYIYLIVNAGAKNQNGTPKNEVNMENSAFPIVGLIGFFLYIYLFKVDILGIITTA